MVAPTFWTVEDVAPYKYHLLQNYSLNGQGLGGV